MPIIVMCNLKGGVAKTTTAVAVAECLANDGRRTLLIDADHQCMAGELSLGEAGQLNAERSRRTLHDLLAAMVDDEFEPDQFPAFTVNGASNIAGGLPNLSVLPCSIRIDDFTTNMAKARRGHRSNEEFLQVFRRRKQSLRRWLTSEFDYTVIDCPPSLAVQVQFFLGVADHIVVPCVPDRLSVRGSFFLMERIAAKGFKASPLGTVWTLYREQNNVHRRMVDAANRGNPPMDKLPKPFKTIIPNAARIAESTEPGLKPATFRHKYTPHFGNLFKALCGEIVGRATDAAAERAAAEKSAAGDGSPATPAVAAAPSAV